MPRRRRPGSTPTSPAQSSRFGPQPRSSKTSTAYPRNGDEASASSVTPAGTSRRWCTRRPLPAGRCRSTSRYSPMCTATTAKQLVWCYTNLATPVTDLDRPTAVRSQLTPSSVVNAARDLRSWMNWLEARDVRRFSEVSDNDFEAYCDELGSAGIDRSTIAYRLFAVTRAWLYAPYVPPADRLPRPTWERGEGRVPTHSDRPIGPVRTRRCPSILKPCLRCSSGPCDSSRISARTSSPRRH